MNSELSAVTRSATQAKTAAVGVSAPARLHLGFVDLNGNLGRKFGSLGLAINQPATELTLERSDIDIVVGAEQERARLALQRYKSLLRLEGSYRVNLTSSIPAHSGLGSGTQLAMAVGGALAALEGLETELRALGEMQNRGARSAIGMAAFEAGGFVVDGGRSKRDSAPPVVVRANFPTEWRILLVLDPNNVGVHGHREVEAFGNLPPMSQSVSADLCRLTLMQLLPALAESDIDAFGAAVSEVQRANGEYFASEQGGGIWSSQAVAKTVKKMSDLGAVGIGQSSWGPTGFAFVPSKAKADEIVTALQGEVAKEGLNLLIARGRNAGAKVHYPIG